jgi:16S rRNA (guanine(966)-N(2))-methyltransferase RsmD
VRVVGGSARGRKLLASPGQRIRPTADRVKESIFNILASRWGTLAGCRVLDVFAGTGNLGIEALSRGAAAAVFIDSHRESAALIRQNLAALGFTDRGRVLCQEALAALKFLTAAEHPFGLVFLDPPYRQGLLVQALELLAGSPLLTAQTLVVAEAAGNEVLPATVDQLTAIDRRVYGDTAVTFYSLADETAQEVT